LAAGDPLLVRTAGHTRSGGGTRGQAFRGGAFLILIEYFSLYSRFSLTGWFSVLAGGCHTINKLHLEQFVGEQSFFQLHFCA
jgi:hypothetical protein